MTRKRPLESKQMLNVSKVTSSDMGDNTFEYKLVITEIKQYHNGPGHLFAENILADITCPFTIFVDSSGTVLGFILDG